MKSTEAYTLVELVIALALLAIILTFTLPIIIGTNNVNKAAEHNLKAKTIAQNQIEEIIMVSSQLSEDDFVNVEFSKLKEALNNQIGESDFTSDLQLFQDDTNPEAKDHNKKVMLKVFYKDKLLYETETWLRYAHE
ncbi:prepilin-type N-terminal cleavage/methylation domain-containing protein [Erysipelothrix urinaevulpis]|uniref:prepilin-type N-terminal cleavage/methylation domain-containing protein n=1 Tax=Erysipelothrix urinaevulpis TaxID=2683717 RepID=UPI0013585994|nr:prepilin-type N-terminal cleavage/methylation domain-containing protein [Erysipelothrix urinaevulpis]